MVNSTGNWYAPWADKTGTDEQKSVHAFLRHIRAAFHHQQLVVLTEEMSPQDWKELVARGGAFTDEQFEKFLKLAKGAEEKRIKALKYGHSDYMLENYEEKARALQALDPPFSFMPPPGQTDSTFLQKFVDWYTWKEENPEQARKNGSTFPTSAMAGECRHNFLWQSIAKRCFKDGRSQYSEDDALKRYELDLLKKSGFFDFYYAKKEDLHYDNLKDLPKVRELIEAKPVKRAKGSLGQASLR